MQFLLIHVYKLIANKVNFVIAMPQRGSEIARTFRKKLKEKSKLHEVQKKKPKIEKEKKLKEGGLSFRVQLKLPNKGS